MSDTTTGWPAPPLAQDDNRGFFKWLAGRMNSRQLINQAAEAIKEETMDNNQYPAAAALLIELGYVWNTELQAWMTRPLVMPE